MLDSFIISATRGAFKIIIPDTRRRDGKTNAEVQQFVSVERPFFAFTNDEGQILRREVEKRIQKEFNNVFR
jgi:hypothetical protein